MNIEELKKQKSILETKIKKIERGKAQRGLLKKCKEIIGHCYRFRNGYSGTSEYWYIYAEVKDSIIDDNNCVYTILDKYEKTKDGEIKIGTNIRELETVSPMHCWSWISKEKFEENKQEIINRMLT